MKKSVAIVLSLGIGLSLQACWENPETPVPDGQAPVVSIAYPHDGGWAGEEIDVRIVATDDDSVRIVMLWVDEVSAGRDSVPPYCIPWAPPSDGRLHTLIARAWDMNDNVSESEPVTVRVPTADFAMPQLLSPPHDTLFGDVMEITFTWAGQDSVSAFQFKLVDNYYFDLDPITVELSDTMLRLPAPAPGVYYWNLRAGVADSAWGPWSEPRSLHLGPVFDGQRITLREGSTGRDVTPCADGGLLLAGSLGAFDFWAGDDPEDVLLLKLDSSGEVEWYRRYLDEVVGAYAHRVLPREGGGWLVMGGGSPYLIEGNPVTILDIAPNGDLHNTRTFSEPYAKPRGFIAYPGNELIAYFDAYGTQDYRVVTRVDASGTNLWRRQVGEPDNGDENSGTSHFGVEILDDPARGEVVILRGDQSWDHSDPVEGFWTSNVGCSGRNTDTGELIWELDLLHGQEIPGSPDNAPLTSPMTGYIDADGTIFCLAYQISNGMQLIRVEQNRIDFTVTPLTDLMVRRYKAMDRLSTGEFILVGGPNGDSGDAVIAAIDDFGSVIWQRAIAGDYHLGEFHGLAILPGDEVLAIGTFHSDMYERGFLCLRRFDATGNDITP